MSDTAWVATRKGLFELKRDGGSWRIVGTSFLGEPVTAVLPPDPAHPARPMLAALNLGHFGVKVHASDDAGVHWREVAAPVFPPQPEASVADGDVRWSLQQIWTLAASGQDVWAGTLPGGLFHSADGGVSWTLNDALWSRPERREWFGGGYDVPGIHAIVIDPRTAATGRRRILLGISCGGAWASDDDGANWRLSARGMQASYVPPDASDSQNVQDPHRIVGCASAPSRLWCQHHEGIWTSTDGGASWARVNDVPVSAFGFAVAVDPRNGDRAWFIPAVKDECRVPVDGRLVVLRTDDGGASFDVLRDGLPQSHCYDLFYRHALDVGADGRTLMMGSTTGGLWASDDAGDHWQTVSQTLPPIFAVALGR